MKLRASVILAGAFALVAGSVAAQTPAGCEFLCSPSLVAQPGLIVLNAIDPPAGVDSRTDFNLRFTTVVPTALPRLALVALFQWQPSERSNDPAIVYGGSIKLVRPSETGGWLGVSFDPLGVLSPGSFGDEKAYTHKLDLEGALDFHVFQQLPPDNYLRNLSLYGLVDYLAAGVPDGSDRWVLLTGVTIPLAPWPHPGTAQRTAHNP
jgi:hypothetical protein